MVVSRLIGTGRRREAESDDSRDLALTFAASEESAVERAVHDRRRAIARLRRAEVPRAEEAPLDAAAGEGSVIAAWAVFILLFLALLAATVLDNAVRIGGPQ
jgi:hypothetical protein